MPGLTNYKQLNKIYNQDFTEKEFNEFETKLFNDKLDLTTCTTEIPDDLDALCKYWHMRGLITCDKYLECANKLVELNDSRGYLRLGLLHNGYNDEINKTKSAEYFKKSADMGNTFAAHNIAYHYLKQENYELCLHFIEKAYDLNPCDYDAVQIIAYISNILMKNPILQVNTYNVMLGLLKKTNGHLVLNSEKNKKQIELIKLIISAIEQTVRPVKIVNKRSKICRVKNIIIGGITIGGAILAGLYQFI